MIKNTENIKIIKIINWQDKNNKNIDINIDSVLGRNKSDSSENSPENLKIEKTVREIIQNVRKNGDNALFEYSEKFDKAKLDSLKVSAEEIENAYKNTDKCFIETLEEAKKNITSFHQKQMRNGFITNEENGIVLGQKIIPIDRAGIYVPGGTAAYPSTVLMNALPAKIAGVAEIVMTTPPLADGSISPVILASAAVAGVDTIYKTGGAQAIAALCYGTESIPRVDKIVGPGNIYVATAKKLCYGQTGIDMIAGPSEILILADGTASAKNIAADMLSQAEHDKLAASILITTSNELAKKVELELDKQLKLLSRREIAEESIKNYGLIIIAENMNKAVEISNKIAPEHLEICVDEPFELLGMIKHAGSVFLGKNTPEALGDYFAGPNHTLPTSGTARFSSPLSVDDFVKKTSFIYYSKPALEKVKDRIVDFAGREGLEAHAKSVKIRFEGE